jgi:hypothetical protein
MYHVTLSSHVDSILGSGLEPRIGDRSRTADEQEPAIYLFSDYDSLQDASWLADCFDDDTMLTVLAITGYAPDTGFYETAITENIPPEHISVTDIAF